MAKNFFFHGKITTTISKVKVLRPYVERMVQLAKKNTEGTKNVLLRKTGDSEAVSVLIKQVAPVFQEKQGGYVRVVKTGIRPTDGTEMGRLEWTLPVVIEKKEAEVKKSEKAPKVEVKKAEVVKPKKETKVVKKVTKKS